MVSISLYIEPYKVYKLSKITLFNVLGQAVKLVQDVHNQRIILDVGNLGAGVYFLKAEGYTLRKIIVTKE